MFDNIKDAMTFTKGERTAIIVLAAVILLIIAANFFVAKRPSNVNFYLHNLDSIIALHESAISSQQSAISNQQTVISKEEASTSKVHQTKTNIQKSKTKVHQTKTNIQKPKTKVHQTKTNRQKPIAKIQINTADTLALQNLPGIGPYFAKNIISYREKLGGFIETNQLLEVYAFDSARLETIKSHIIIDSIETRKIKINHDDFKTILRHPYIEYEDVKKIINYRESHGMIQNWDTYVEVLQRNDVDERLRWYLQFHN